MNWFINGEVIDTNTGLFGDIGKMWLKCHFVHFSSSWRTTHANVLDWRTTPTTYSSLHRRLRWHYFLFENILIILDFNEIVIVCFSEVAVFYWSV